MKDKDSISDDDLNEMQNSLQAFGWIYKGADWWLDPITGEKYSTVAAYEVLDQRLTRRKQA